MIILHYINKKETNSGDYDIIVTRISSKFIKALYNAILFLCSSEAVDDDDEEAYKGEDEGEVDGGEA